jgi:hypothetical protein
MKVYLVGSHDCEFTNTRYTCFSKETAFKRWEEIRQELIKDKKELLEACPNDKTTIRILKNLQETDPEKMDNYPHEEPFIHEMETEN